MKELSSQSLIKIRDVIHGENYANIKARLDQLLPPAYAETFAKISIIGQSGVWFGDDDIEYRKFSEAGQSEKEEIALRLEECRKYVCENLQSQMKFVQDLFVIPGQEQIFWHRDLESNAVRVVLTQWGFENKGFGDKVDVISVLIDAARSLQQQDVMIHIDYSDGLPAESIPFNLFVFNNEKHEQTDGDGNYQLGKMMSGQRFAVEDIAADNHVDFIVTGGEGIYNAVFDYVADYVVAVEDQDGTLIPGYAFDIDGKPFSTDADGKCCGSKKLGPDTSIEIKAEDSHELFPLHRDPDLNRFVLRVTRNSDNPDDSEDKHDDVKDEYVTIRLYDFDDTPLPNLPFKITGRNNSCIECETDKDGVARVNKKLLSRKSRHKVRFVITAQYREQLDNSKKNEK